MGTLSKYLRLHLEGNESGRLSSARFKSVLIVKERTIWYAELVRGLVSLSRENKSGWLSGVRFESGEERTIWK